MQDPTYTSYCFSEFVRYSLHTWIPPWFLNFLWFLQLSYGSNTPFQFDWRPTSSSSYVVCLFGTSTIFKMAGQHTSVLHLVLLGLFLFNQATLTQAGGCTSVRKFSGGINTCQGTGVIRKNKCKKCCSQPPPLVEDCDPKCQIFIPFQPKMHTQ